MRIRLNQQRLVAFLAQSRLSQNHWAIKLGFSRGHWSEIVNGKHPYPSPKSRGRMLEVLGLSFDELFEVEAGAPSWADTDFRRAIADRYLIDAEIGQGGMGAVYQARDVRLGRVVAVKVVSPEAVSEIGVTQFLREMTLVAHLQHPHILPLYDSGEAAGHPFYVMPYVRGGSLRARLKSATRLAVDEVARLTQGIASALQYAHEQRVLHCDVKPENILLDGLHPYVMDFGIARKLRTEVLAKLPSKELDLSAGTPAYVSPEQATREPELDARSDVYSLACVTYEMLTGHPPFEGTSTTAVVSRRFFAPPPSPREFAPEIPASLERAVERGMEVDPRRRTATAAEFAATVTDGARQTSGALAQLSVGLTRGINRFRRSGPLTAVRFRSPLIVESLWHDLTYAGRALRRSPAFTTVVAITLSLGIGANTAIFSVVRGVLLKPLPHHNGDQLMYLRHSMDAPGGANLTFSVPEVRDLRNGVPSFSGIAEYSGIRAVLRGNEGAVRLSLGLVTGNYFEVMGLGPVRGRVTDSRDDGPGAAPVLILTHEAWINRFGGDDAIVGKQVTLESKPTTVIGVLQPAPVLRDQVDALGNMVISDHHISATMVEGRTHRMTEVVARLEPNVSLEHARAEVASVYARMQSDYREAYDPGSHYRVAVIPFKEMLGERAQETLWLLMGAAALVLIISAASVANLTLMRGVRREHELVTRAALGAGTARLRRLLLVENLVLAGLGAGLAVLIAIGGTRLLTSLAARYSPRANEIRLDVVVFAFTLALSVVLALLLSFLASLPGEKGLASRIVGAARVSGSLRKQRLLRGLVVVQVAVSTVLLAGAGLLTRSLIRVADVDTGLRTEEILTMQVAMLTRTESRDSTLRAGARQRLAEIKREVAALPGVRDVAQGAAPLRRTGIIHDVKVENKVLAPGAAVPRAEIRGASPNYFQASGIPLLQGRPFTESDEADGAARVVIVNKTFADQHFPGEDPLGRRMAFTGELLRFAGVSGDWRTIVGVVGNTRDGDIDAKPEAVVFTPGGGSTFVVRADSNAALLIPVVTRIVRRIAPLALIENAMTLTQFKDTRIASRRLNATLISSFGILALIIAAVGIAGVLAFSVSTRVHEIGIRMSLGADRATVKRMIVMEGGTLVAIGLVLGAVGAVFAGQGIRGFLYEVSPNDPVTLVGVTVIMVAIGVAACWIPAMRAARVDPATTMRSE